MTFEEWWKTMKPAECDEVKDYFQEAWQLAFSDGYGKGVAAFHDAVKLEREECAEFAEGATAYTQFQTVEHYKMAAFIAAAIRERSNAPLQGPAAASCGRSPASGCSASDETKKGDR